MTPRGWRPRRGRCDAIVVRNRTQVRGALLDALQPRCTVVGRLGVGLDNIDVPACEARGMRVIPATGANALSVAEYVVGTAMLLLRGVYFSSAAAGRRPVAARGAVQRPRDRLARRWAWSASDRSGS